MMSHKELVKLAGQWLSRSRGCNPVFMEKGSQGCTEIPDAIGWTCDKSILVESKATKEDFKANSTKSLALGNERYFMVTRELYEQIKDIIPDGWGIVIADGVRGFPMQERFKRSKAFESDLRHEVRYLRSRIIGIQFYGQV